MSSNVSHDHAMTGLGDALTSALQEHPAVRAVRLVGSRQRGAPGPLSDWDFAVEVMDFAAVAAALPELLTSLAPLAQQWDPLSRHRTYMLVMSGPVKVDLLFDEPQVPAPPWEVRADTLRAIDGHFWDWVYWLASKHVAGGHTQVAPEFAKLAHHVLGPLGAHAVPDTIEEAIATYVAARADAELRLGETVSRDLEMEIRRGLRGVGYGV
jgi:predicted nucleotidyltransferase